MGKLKKLLGLEKPLNQAVVALSPSPTSRWNPDEQEVWDKVMSYPASDWTNTNLEGHRVRTKTYKVVGPSGSEISLCERVKACVQVSLDGHRREFDSESHQLLIDGKEVDSGLNLCDKFVAALFNEVVQRVAKWRRTDPSYLQAQKQAQEDLARVREEQRIQSELEAEKRKRDTLDKL